MKIERRLQKLLNLKSGSESLVSLYLNLDPVQRENRKYRTELKNLFKNYQSVLNSKNISESRQESINKKFQEIEKYINDDDKIRGMTGIALFCSLNTKLWEVFNVPMISRNRIILDRIPHLSELLKIQSDYGNIALLVINQTKARLFSSTIEGTEEISGYLYPGATRARRFQSPAGKFKQRVSPSSGGGLVSQGFGEYTFNRSIENELHHHFKYVSDMVFEYYKTNKFDRLILAGDSQLLKEFSYHLHSYLDSIVLGKVYIDLDAFSPEEAQTFSTPLIQDMMLANQNMLLQNFEENLGLGYAVNGIQPVIEALSNGQIKTLILSEGYAQEGFICPESGLIFVNKENQQCPEQKEPVYYNDIVDQVLEQSLRMSSEIEILKDEKLKKQIGGIAAVLRFVL